MQDANETANDSETSASLNKSKTYAEDSGQFSFVSDGSHPAFNSHEFNRMLFDSPPSMLNSPCFDSLSNYRNSFPLLPTRCHGCTKEFGGLGGTTYSCNHRLCKDCASPISEGNQCPLCSGRPIMPMNNPQFPAQMFLSPMMTPRNIDDSFHNMNQLSAGIQNISLSANDLQESFNIWERPKSNSILFESINSDEHPPVFSPTISDNVRGQNSSNLHLLPPMDPRTAALLLMNDIKQREKNVADAAESVRRMIEGFEVNAQAVANEIRSIVHMRMTALEDQKRELLQKLETVRATKLDSIKCQAEQPHMPRKEIFSYTKPSLNVSMDTRKGRNYADIQTSGELFSFGKEGSGDGELCRPWGICIDAHGRVLVADRSNNRIQIFDKDGNFLMKFGQGGARPGQFDRPAGITTNSFNNIIVADKDNHRVQVFDENGGFLFKFGERGRPVGMFNYPWGVACNSLGHIAVSDTRNHRVQIFNAKGVFMRKCGFDTAYFYKDLDSPRGVCFLPDGQLLITDFNNHRLAVWSPRNGSDMKVYGTEGEIEGQFCRPQGITTDAHGHVLICDSRNNRIQVFSGDDMRCVAVFGGNNNNSFQMPAELPVPYQSTGPSNGSPFLPSPMGGSTPPVLDRAQLDRPTDIAVSPDGRVYVVDFGNNCIRVF